MKKFVVLSAIAFSVAAALGANEPETPKRPNIIIILADDLGFSDVGCYGAEIRTPNLDQLASDGLRFTQFYNASKCEPTRSSLLSGLYWQQTERGIKRGITIGQALHSVGYTTLAVGKWHLDGNPVDRGFDHYFGFLNGGSNYFKGNKWFRLDHDLFTVPASGFYTTDAFTDYAIRFVDEARQSTQKRPFFLYLAYNAPHDPLQAPAEDIARYKGKYSKGWDELRRERYERQIALGVIKKQWELSPRPDNIPAWDSLTEKYKQFEDLRMAVYAAMVDRLDQNIGRLLAKLKEWKIEDNTLVIFLSDNGANPYDRTADRKTPPGGPDSNWKYGVGWAALSNTPFRLYKRNQHEGGIATPFIVRWPAGIKNRGAITDERAHIVDIMATCVQLAGCDYAGVFEGKPSPPSVPLSADKSSATTVGPPVPPLAGKSMASLFEGKSWEGHDALFFQFLDQRAARVGDWKLSSFDGRPWELYRMDLDRTEVHNLADKQPQKLKELEALYDQWWNRPDIIIKDFRSNGKTPGWVDPFIEDKNRPEKMRKGKRELDEGDD
jgi:arylsulfatase A-like enzyme